MHELAVTPEGTLGIGVVAILVVLAIVGYLLGDKS